MQRLMHFLVLLYVAFVSCGAQALIVGTTSNPAYTIKSACTSAEPEGYALVKVGYVSGGICQGNSQYDFIELKNLTKVTVCNFVAPAGWASTGSARDDTGTCGWGKPQHEITRVTGDVMSVCSFIPPKGWVITGSRNTSDNLCGPSYPIHTITRLTSQVDMTTCNYIAPDGWVITETNVRNNSQCLSTVNGAAHRIRNLAGMTRISICAKYLQVTLKKPTGWNVLSTGTTSACGLDAGNTWDVMSSVPLPEKVPLYLYASDSGDRVYTVARNDAGYAYYGFSYVSVMGYVLKTQAVGAVPFNRYYSGYGADHFYTTERNDSGLAGYSYGFEGVEGYIFNVPAPGTVPLYQYHNAYLNNYYYALNYFTNGAYGYAYQKIAGYVYPSP